MSLTAFLLWLTGIGVPSILLRPIIGEYVKDFWFTRVDRRKQSLREVERDRDALKVEINGLEALAERLIERAERAEADLLACRRDLAGR